MNCLKYIVLEWKIENFSYWIKEVHGAFITKLTSKLNYTIRLFPKGLEACGEHLVVQITDHKNLWRYSGDLTFTSSDGSTLFFQQVCMKHKATTLTLPIGPKFEELLRQMKGSKGFQKDLLTLRLRWIGSFSYVEYISTTIDVFDASIKISCKILENLKSGDECISYFNYPLDDGVKAEVVLLASEGKFDHSKIILTLKASIHEKNVLILTRLSILNNNDDVMKSEKNEHVFRKDEEWSFANSLTREEVTKEEFSLILCLKIIPNNMYKNSLRISSAYVEEVSPLPSDNFKNPSSTNVFDASFLKNPTGVLIQPSNSITVLTIELMSLHLDGAYSDFEFTCENVSFATHKAILSTRSPVFKRLFSSNLKEATSGTMVIKDLDPSTLARFLAFLYTGTVEDLNGESAIKLYYAAEKYQVPTLKKDCANFLCADLSIANVGDILSLANKTQDQELIAVAHNFILKNYDGVMRSEEWVSFVRSEPLLAAETLTHFSTKGKLKALP